MLTPGGHSRKPETGKFRAIQLDDFDGTDWVLGDYETLWDASTAAQAAVDKTAMQIVYVYDASGKYVGDFSRLRDTKPASVDTGHAQDVES